IQVDSVQRNSKDQKKKFLVENAYITGRELCGTEKQIRYVEKVVVERGTPGRFMLSYQPRLKARHEFVSVTPEGFRYRKQSFDSLNAMLKWFKEHHREPVPNTPGVPSVAQSVRTPGAFSLASM
ncbi:unnamed protein product, partial [Notodromas monacha]